MFSRGGRFSARIAPDGKQSSCRYDTPLHQRKKWPLS
ncbi:hypothetical protein E2C01_076250 [Portunus trituberculatus]|uniref:Uncharacterized protein n=1 Tax=Portunus trituberculatus TaxID=210409 RepID=A0A5B7IH87_PORTR|nr:hypothetical protein [Portunus trituberculatus]